MRFADRRTLRRFLAILLGCFAIAAGLGCEQSGDRAQKTARRLVSDLDAKGKRVVVVDADGKPRAKYRRRRDRVVVFGDQMTKLGEVRFSTAPDAPALTLVVGDTTSELTHPDDATYVLDGAFRLERVELGWAVFDKEARSVGYISRPEETVFHFRNDYTANWRYRAARGEASIKAPDGKVVLAVEPAGDGVQAFGYVVDGLEPLGSAALSVWIDRFMPVEATSTGSGAAARSDARAPADAID